MKKHHYRCLAEFIQYLCQTDLLEACLFTSELQQHLDSLPVQHILKANYMIHELLCLQPMMSNPKLNNVDSAASTTISDAMRSRIIEVYGQSGILNGLNLVEPDRIVYYPIKRTLLKQKNISYSSRSAKIPATVEADDRGFYIKPSLYALLSDQPLKHELLVDWKSLLETITTLHQTQYDMLRRIVAHIRDYFEAKELYIVRRIPGCLNYVDILTKKSIVRSQRLNSM